MARFQNQLSKLGALSHDELHTEWARLYGSPAPRLTPYLLRLGLAYRIQEKALGGLPAVIARELARSRGGGSSSPPPRTAVAIRPGTKLVRTWQGCTVEVLVTEDGFLFNGDHHASLTSIARAVTGARWSGPRFFGLTGNA